MEFLECSLVKPVGDENWCPFYIPVYAVGTVDEQGSSNTIRVLGAVVAVVPCMSVLEGLELVRVGVTLSDGALGNTINAVHFISMELTDSVPMNSRAIVGKCISDIYGDTVSALAPRQK